MTEPAEYARRALRAHTAMQRQWRRRDGIYRRPGRLGRIGFAEHLWPVARAFAATLDLVGIPSGLRPGFDTEAAIARDLGGLERYWDATGPRPAYASDMRRTPWGGDRYYDDNAWVGLALIQLERLRPGTAPLGRAQDIFQFALGGWDERQNVAHPGGTFWVEQGRGAGRRNHDRNTVSNAPHAELGLHLDELGGVDQHRPAATRMYEWVGGALRAPGGLYFDKLRGDGSVDRALWSYNQGSMIGAAALQYRTRGATEFLRAAETTSRAALQHYAGRYFEQAPGFNAIFFRNLLLVHAVSDDPALREQISIALGGYADEAWSRTRDDLLPRGDGSGSVLDQSALISVLALGAWKPGDYRRLA